MIQKERMEQKRYFGFPRNILILSLVSLLNDIGGETIKRTIPLYLANALGVKTTVIGLIEGIGEATPQLLQPLSGYLSDKTQKRKILILAGQMLRSSMLFLYSATSWFSVLFFRFLDRSGKGISNAPRDALISVSSEDHHVGRAFGLNRALDNVGAVIGMLGAAAIILVIGNGTRHMTQGVFQTIVLLAAIPLIVAMLLSIVFLHDVPVAHKGHTIRLHNRLGRKYHVFLFLSFLFTIGNSSDAFIILKAQRVGVTLWQIFVLLAAYSLVSSVSGFSLSNLSDRVGRKKLLIAGWMIYGIVYILFANVRTPLAIAGLFLLYGLYYGCTEGAAKALIADVVDRQHQGTAYGVYNMVVGVTLLPASLLAGYLWQAIGPAAAFYFGSTMAIVSALGLLLFL